MAEVTGRDEALERTSGYIMKTFGLSEGESHVRAGELLTVLAAPPGVSRQGTHEPWSFLLRGLLAIVIGFFLLFRPMSAPPIFGLVFGVWAFTDGVLAIGAAMEGHGSWWRLWLSGLAGLAVGLIALSRPWFAATAFLVVVAVWAIVRGISEISAGIRGRPAVGGEGWIVVSGVLSTAFGVLLLVVPHVGIPLLIWMVGIYAIADGASLIGLSLRLRHDDDLVGRSQLRVLEERRV